MIDTPAKEEISRKLGPLVTPERIILLFAILAIYSNQSIFMDMNFLEMEIGKLISNTVDNIKSTKTWIILYTLTVIFLASPILTHKTISKLSEISLKHSHPLHDKVHAEAKQLSDSDKTINELKVEAAENSLKLRKNAQFISRSISAFFSLGFCLFIFLKGYFLIVPASIVALTFAICYICSIELIKENYENVQKYRLAAIIKEQS